MGVVHASRGSLKAVSDNLLSEAKIVCHLAKATFGSNSKVNWDIYLSDYSYIRDSIEATIPGFEQFNKRIQNKEGFYLPNGSRDNTYNTWNGKANFTVTTLEPIRLKPGEYLMMTIRTHDQFNTTIYGLDDRYRGIYNERRVILMNQDDISDAGFTAGDLVDLYNFDEGIERVVRQFLIVAYNIPRGCTATYFPETNVLVPISSTAKKSNTPTSKSVVIEVRKSN